MPRTRQLAIALSLLACSLAFGQTLRWSSQGDPQTMDPHAQNELLTNAMNGQVYEGLTGRDRNLRIVPALATEWQQTGPMRWRMKLRAGVKFHDGTPFTADDVVFSVLRAKEPTSAIRAYAVAMGEPRKIDDLTVEFVLPQVNPIFLEHANTVQIMSRAWSEKNHSAHPQDFKNGQITPATLQANGTGPFILVSRQPDVKTVYRRNPAWWGKPEGNVQEVVYTPIKSDATRSAALLSGEIDLLQDPVPQDLDRLRNTPGTKVLDGPENRIIFIGMDQGRDELLYSNVKGKNPFKDVRVRRALYQAVNIEAIRSKTMRGQALPTGSMTPSPLGDFNDPALEARLPFDQARARNLLVEAGYPNGFEVQMDCPNNRYINDEEICVALSAMWAQVGVKVKVNAMPKTVYFAKGEKLDMSMFMLGWGGSITDAETLLTPILRPRGEGGVGSWNWANYKDAKLDELAASSSKEPDPAKRERLIKAALREQSEQVHYIPLHRQVIPWAMRSNVTAVHRADNWLEWRWITLSPKP